MREFNDFVWKFYICSGLQVLETKIIESIYSERAFSVKKIISFSFYKCLENNWGYHNIFNGGYWCCFQNCIYSMRLGWATVIHMFIFKISFFWAKSNNFVQLMLQEVRSNRFLNELKQIAFFVKARKYLSKLVIKRC